MPDRKVCCETQDGKKVWVNRDQVQPRTSAYGILKKKDKVLVIQAHLPLWEFPGGALEQGESLVEALKREFREETGIEVKPKQLVLKREAFYFTPSGQAYHSHQHFFLVEKTGGRLAYSPDNKTRATWIKIDKLPKADMNRAAFHALQEYLRGQAR